MIKNKEKNKKRAVRQKKVRAKIKGTKDCPRLNVFRSNKGMYVQLIDDDKSITIVAADSSEIKVGKKTPKKDASFELGKLIAKKALEKKIEKVVFDRGGYQYHGRVKSLADGAREGGLKF
jgi:large subunit ribosomal protein L18